jgi:hypothetical protein
MCGQLTVPLSARELCDAVRHARPIDTKRLDRVLRVDEGRGVVEVQAHAAWRSLAARLRPGDARAAGVRTTMPTVGGSIARNAAGPDGRPSVAHVESLALVTPEGELRRVSRHDHPELFALAVGGQGLFGVLFSVTLRIESLARALDEAAPVEALAQPAPGAGARALQLLLPPDGLGRFIAEARTRCGDWRVPVEGIEVRRLLQDDETFLRWADRRYAEVALQLAQPADTLGGAVRATQLRRELIDAAIAHGGSFAIACTTDATRSQAETCYPMLKRFLAEKRRFDPSDKLANAWYWHHRGLLGREPCEVRWAN